MQSNLVRANPNFHNRPRYDFVLIKVDEAQHIFAQLVYIFGIQVDEKPYYLALVTPFDAVPSLFNRKRDGDLRLTRVRARPRSEAVIISTESIVRGGLLVEDFGSPIDGEHLVIDFIDGDMWWRMKHLTLARKVNL